MHWPLSNIIKSGRDHFPEHLSQHFVRLIPFPLVVQLGEVHVQDDRQISERSFEQLLTFDTFVGEAPLAAIYQIVCQLIKGRQD